MNNAKTKIGLSLLPLALALLFSIAITTAFTSASPTPNATAAARETATPTPIPTMVWPMLNSVEPQEISAGEVVTITGNGGYLFYPPSGYDESSRSFDLVFNSEVISTIGCYVNYCQGNLLVPADAEAGVHLISAQGGSTIGITITQTTEGEVLSRTFDIYVPLIQR